MTSDEIIEYLTSIAAGKLSISFSDIEGESDIEIAKVKYALFALFEDLEFHKTRSNTLINNLKETLFESAAIVITNAKGVITDVNDEFLKLSGFEKNDLLNKTQNIMNSTYHTDSFYKNIRDTVKSGLVWRGEICNTALNGSSFWLYSNIFPIKDTQGEIYEFWNVSTDITEKIEVESELLSKERALAEASRMASLGRFVGGVAHEINNPLAIIASKVSLIKLKMQKEASELGFLESDLNVINDTVNRIAGVIDSLKSFTHDSLPIAKSKENLSQIIRNTMEMCAEKFRVNEVELRTNLDPDIEFYCNKLHISEILMNLINNSFEAILQEDVKWIELKTIAEDQLIKISVTDCGRGIDESILGEIMNPYFTTKDANSSSGLGLTISNNILKRYNGQILLNCDSEHTQFIVELPMD